MLKPTEPIPPGERPCSVCGYLREDHYIGVVSRECAQLATRMAHKLAVRDEYSHQNDYQLGTDDDVKESP